MRVRGYEFNCAEAWLLRVRPCRRYSGCRFQVHCYRRTSQGVLFGWRQPLRLPRSNPGRMAAVHRRMRCPRGRLRSVRQDRLTNAADVWNVRPLDWLVSECKLIHRNLDPECRHRLMCGMNGNLCPCVLAVWQLNAALLKRHTDVRGALRCRQVPPKTYRSFGWFGGFAGDSTLTD